MVGRDAACGTVSLLNLERYQQAKCLWIPIGLHWYEGYILARPAETIDTTKAPKHLRLATTVRA